jgi:hypothetical protein
MKAFRYLLLAGLAALFSVTSLSLVAADVSISPATETLYVKVDSPDLIEFRHYRLAVVDGSELILSTLKKTAADQARFAQYPGKVEVLEDDAKAPEGAAVLVLMWDGGAVSATLQRGSQKQQLGAVSRAPLSGHPDYAQMRLELDRGSRDERRDADLRAKTQMYLYESLRQIQRNQAKG